MTNPSEVERARRIAEEIRGVWPAKAAEIDAAIAALEGGRREGLTLEARFHFRLEKFDGDPAPGQAPVEVIEGEDRL